MRRLFQTPEDKRALTAGLLLLSIGLAILWGYDRCSGQSPEAPPPPGHREAFLSLEKQVGRATPAAPSRPAAETFPFDPNHADSLTLLRLGLRPWQIGNMLKYRRKGGLWRSAEDFRRLYGLSEADYRRLRPYVRIRPADAARPGHSSGYAAREARPESPWPRAEKYAEGTQIPLNASDTTALRGIPGIGSYRAAQIVRYRERLGGFVSLDQLNEIEDLPPGITRWFRFDPVRPTPLRINRASFKQLVRHPYLSYEQTRVIVNHIRKYGPIRQLGELRAYDLFTEADLQRLAPYLSFE